MIDESFVKAVTDLALAGHGYESYNDGSGGERNYLFTKGGLDTVVVKDITNDLALTREFPRARRGQVQLNDLSSFSAFVNRMKLGNSVLFANFDPNVNTITAVFDYHDAMNDPEGTGQTSPARRNPQWARFSAAYSFPESRPYKAWSGHNRRPLTQGELAHFIETNLLDVSEPKAIQETNAKIASALGLKVGSPADLLRVSRGLALAQEENVSQAVNTTTGETEVAYTLKAGGAAKVSVPGAFLITVPVFEGGEWFQLLVRWGMWSRFTGRPS